MGAGPELLPTFSGRRELVFWMVLAYVLTFLLTRLITHAIRAGRGPFHDTDVGGVRLPHAAGGILLLLGVGAGDFAYRPGGAAGDALAPLLWGVAAFPLDDCVLMWGE